VVDAVVAGPRVAEQRSKLFRGSSGGYVCPCADAKTRPIDDATLLAVLGGVSELVLQHLIERRAESLADLPPAREELLGRVFLDKLST
jgi:hypothetical protein